MGIQIGILSSDNDLILKIIKILTRIYNKNRNEIDKITVTNLKNPDKAFDYITYEFPDYLIFNYNDNKIDPSKILQAINFDPWLHLTGIIVLINRQDQKNIPEIFHKLNILSFVHLNDLDFQLERILKVVLINKQVLIQKELSKTILEKRSGTFILNNDISMISSYVNILTTTLVNERYISSNKSGALQIALTELLINAIEHGNCNINYEEKSKFLETNGDINNLIKIKNNDKTVAQKKVFFDYSISEENLVFKIKDEGKGFDHKSFNHNPDSDIDLMSLHGRGIFITQKYVDTLIYNDKGNEVTISLKTDRDKKTIPEGFLSQKELLLNLGDVVFKEGEKSNCLYYIITGTYQVIVKDKILAELNPTDTFLGEMSFLLNNKRVATIVAKTEGKLIEIPKNSFINILKKYPNYGLFLSKLLAKRLENTNNKKID